MRGASCDYTPAELNAAHGGDLHGGGVATVRGVQQKRFLLKCHSRESEGRGGSPPHNSADVHKNVRAPQPSMLIRGEASADNAQAGFFHAPHRKHMSKVHTEACQARYA